MFLILRPPAQQRGRVHGRNQGRRPEPGQNSTGLQNQTAQKARPSLSLPPCARHDYVTPHSFRDYLNTPRGVKRRQVMHQQPAVDRVYIRPNHFQ